MRASGRKDHRGTDAGKHSRISLEGIAGMDVQFTHPEKRGGDEHLGKAGDTEGNHPVQGSPMSGFPCAFDRERELYLAANPFRGNGSRRFVSPKFEMRL